MHPQAAASKQAIPAHSDRTTITHGNHLPSFRVGRARAIFLGGCASKGPREGLRPRARHRETPRPGQLRRTPTCRVRADWRSWRQAGTALYQQHARQFVGTAHVRGLACRGEAPSVAYTVLPILEGRAYHHEVTDTQPTIAQEVERYLRTGDTDPHHTAWPGGFLESAQRAHSDLREALVNEVRRLAAGRTPRPVPEADTVALTRRKVEPMVRGLFPRVEQDAVLAMLEKSVVFLVTREQQSPAALGGGLVQASQALGASPRRSYQLPS
jgi:hypothetical protein